MNEAAAYEALKTRHQAAGQELAKMEAREEQKRERREQILAELKELGVDTDNPAAELKRLDEELSQSLEQATTEVEAFERKLRGATSEAPAEATPQPEPETAPAPAVEDSADDIDI